MDTAGKLSGEAEAARLSKAIMKLPVPGTGLTVEQALDEVCATLYDVDLAKHQRSSFLRTALEAVGVRFQMADPGEQLARDGFLILGWPQRLLDLHPELGGLHPLAHQYMSVG